MGLAYTRSPSLKDSVAAGKRYSQVETGGLSIVLAE